MPGCGPVLDAKFVLYLFSPLLVPLGLLAVGLTVEALASTFGWRGGR